MITHQFATTDTRDGKLPGLYHFEGGFPLAPTTGSTQEADVGASDYNLNLSPATVTLEGVSAYLGVQADIDLDSGDAAILAAGEARYYAAIAWLDRFTGTVKFGVVKGTIAAVASAVKVAAANIQAKIGTTNPYVILGQTKVHRSADAVITQTYDYSDRQASLWSGVVPAAGSLTVLA